MRLASLAEAFDHPDWVYELKYDGWRCLAHVTDGLVSLVSRYGHHYTRFGELAREISRILAGREAVLDGELVCLDAEGKSHVDRGTTIFFLSCARLLGKGQKRVPSLSCSRTHILGLNYRFDIPNSAPFYNLTRALTHSPGDRNAPAGVQRFRDTSILQLT